jgi:glycosyltransferase involved in cell wall biosynthesis
MTSGQKQPYHVGFVMTTEVGLETFYLNLREGMDPELGIIPEWIVINWSKQNGLIERLPVPRALKSMLRARVELLDGFAKGPFDAIFTPLYGLAWLAILPLGGQPYFVPCDSTPRLQYTFGELYRKAPAKWAFYEQQKCLRLRETYRRAAALFPWSRWAAASLIQDYGVDPARVHVVPPGVDLERWRCPPRDKEQGQAVNILFVGGDFYRKGGDLLLEWASRTPTRNWLLHLVTRDTVHAPRSNVRVYNGLSPNSRDLLALYRNAHIFALPTRGDCYSIASIEAMAAGLPAILSRTGGTEDIIRDGETGYLIDTNDASALAERLEHLLAHPEKRIQMGGAARHDAEARYDACRNVGRTVEVMRACLGA